jgi:hypothetical protein
VKKSIKIFWLIPSAAAFVVGLTMWFVAVATLLYRISILVTDGKIYIIHTIDFLPPSLLTWFINNFGKSAYWFLDMDISIPLFGLGLIFIIIGVLSNLAAKKYGN